LASDAQPRRYNLSELWISLDYIPDWNQSPYTISIRGSGDGTFVESGQDTVYFVVHRRDIRRLLDVIYGARYFDFRDVYNTREEVTIGNGGQVGIGGQLVEDQGVIVTTIRINDFTKSVRDECYAPPALRKIQKLIVEVSGVEKSVVRADEASP
jgi:hypothetical protein